MKPIVLNGHLLSLWQTCQRRYKLEQSYQYLKHHPNTLLSTILRSAIFELSSGAEPDLVATKSVNQFISSAKYPGLSVPPGIDTYTLATDYVSTIRTFIEYLTRITLLTTRSKPPITIAHPGLPSDTPSSCIWETFATEDESGVLHRWKFVDYVTEENLIREAHSWSVFGDMAINNSPMDLHLVSIGKRDGSHRISPWCRTYRSPAMNMFKFRKQAGGPLADSWKPIWYSDNPDNDPEVWVNLMGEDGLFRDEGLIRHINLVEINKVHRDEFKRTLQYVCSCIDDVDGVPWYRMPMSRPSCDSPYPCPHQDICYCLDPESELAGSDVYRKL